MSLNALLKSNRLFADLDGTDLEWLEASMVRRQYRAGQVIFHMGDEGAGLYLITRGRVKVSILSRRGEETILAILSGGEMLGELSLIDGKPRSATGQALEETEAFFLSRKAFLRFLRLRFDAVMQVLSVLSHRLRNTDTLLADAHFLTLQPRLAKKILALGLMFGSRDEEKIAVDVQVTQKDLAAMVGASRESVNKQMALLRQSRLVNFEDKRITILDPLRLAGKARMPEPDIDAMWADARG
jgi:CRP-like cAMP-binding protein